jgi:hypothetical protein
MLIKRNPYTLYIILGVYALNTYPTDSRMTPHSPVHDRESFSSVTTHFTFSVIQSVKGKIHPTTGHEGPEEEV